MFPSRLGLTVPRPRGHQSRLVRRTVGEAALVDAGCLMAARARCLVQSLGCARLRGTALCPLLVTGAFVLQFEWSRRPGFLKWPRSQSPSSPVGRHRSTSVMRCCRTQSTAVTLPTSVLAYAAPSSPQKISTGLSTPLLFRRRL
jgi:hypothetical protein